MDPYFRVEVLARTENPQSLVWWAMHQDYAEDFVADQNPPIESEAGALVVKHLLAGERGHYGPLEHPSITLNCGWFPHSVMQQARTHRVGISFDVQSGRYTGERIQQAHKGERPLEEVFYIRPAGIYTNRQGKKYYFSDLQREAQLCVLRQVVQTYNTEITEHGLSEEHARDMIPYAIRQHFVVSCNLRSALHLLDLRAKLDAQLEIRQLCDLIWPHLQAWAPEICEWYAKSRLHKARLAP